MCVGQFVAGASEILPREANPCMQWRTCISRQMMQPSRAQQDDRLRCPSGKSLLQQRESDARRLGEDQPVRGREHRIFAPSTAAKNPYGFLAISSVFNSTAGASSDSVTLAREWDQGVDKASAYINGTSPNGQVVVRASLLDAHIRSPLLGARRRPGGLIAPPAAATRRIDSSSMATAGRVAATKSRTGRSHTPRFNLPVHCDAPLDVR